MTETQAVPVDPLAVTRAAALGRPPVRVQLPLGTVDAAVVADVDPSGMVQLRGASWSLDWWIGAEDRWHHPSLDAAVRQQSIGGAPLVETSMRVPGGDVVHRAYGARARSVDALDEEWSDSAVVVEIENTTAVPVALAVVIRPVTLDGPGRVSSVEVDGALIRVDGEVAAVLSKPAVRRAAGAPGEAARALHAGDDEVAEGSVTSSTGELEAAFVVPLPHGTSVRVMLPRIDSVARRGRRGATSAAPGERWEAPDIEAAAAGWATHVRTLADIDLPEPFAAELCAASEQTLMLAATDDFFDAGTGVTAAQRAEELCDSLVRVGISQPLEPIARALVDAQTLTGVIRMADRSDATVALVHAATPLLLGARSEFWSDELVGPVARAVHRLERGKGLAPGSERSAAVALGRIAPALRSVDQPRGRGGRGIGVRTAVRRPVVAVGGRIVRALRGRHRARRHCRGAAAARAARRHGRRGFGAGGQRRAPRAACRPSGRRRGRRRRGRPRGRAPWARPRGRRRPIGAAVSTCW